MKNQWFQPLMILMILAVGIFPALAQSGHGHSQPTSTPATETAAAVTAEQGAALFAQFGCTACHGPEAGGTDLAPALAGHSEFSVRRQVRAPTGIMPVFTPQQVTTEDLEALIAYISTLQAPEVSADAHDEHAHTGVVRGDISITHHWVARNALLTGDTSKAIHHVTHTLTLVEGAHLALMQSVLDALIGSDFETAATLLDQMLADVGPFAEDETTTYLQLVLLAAEAEDGDTAHHFLTHYRENTPEQGQHLGEMLNDHLSAAEFADIVTMLHDELGDHATFGGAADEHGEHEEAEATEESGAHGGHMGMEMEATQESGDSHSDHDEAEVTPEPTEESGGGHGGHG